MFRFNSIDVGDERILTLQAPSYPNTNQPSFLSAQVLPDRGMMTLQIRARFPFLGEIDLLAPSLQEARKILEQDSEGFPGNASYLVGGAILLPYANRIRGSVSADGRSLRTSVLGRAVHLPANASGKRPGAERFAMHGLILAERIDKIHRETTGERDTLRAFLHAGDFGGCWVSNTEVEIENTLTPESFTVTITARNVGEELLPIGIGWHPYFTLPSGRREQARLYLSARRRVLVNNYDEVLPTGELVPVAGTEFDFSIPGGRPLNDLYLDDCFVDLTRSPAGHAVAEIVDPAAYYGLRVFSASAQVRAFQVYAPPKEGFVVIEPQFNWADPFGPQWDSRTDTGMAVLTPGEAVVYSASVELFMPQGC